MRGLSQWFLGLPMDEIVTFLIIVIFVVTVLPGFVFYLLILVVFMTIFSCIPNTVSSHTNRTSSFAPRLVRRSTHTNRTSSFAPRLVRRTSELSYGKRGLTPEEFKKMVGQHLAEIRLPIDREKMITHLDCTAKHLAFRVQRKGKLLDKRNKKAIRTVGIAAPKELPRTQVTTQSPRAIQRATSGGRGIQGQPQAKYLVHEDYHELQDELLVLEGYDRKYKSNHRRRWVDRDSGQELSTDEFCIVIDTFTHRWRKKLDEIRSRNSSDFRKRLKIHLRDVMNVATEIAALRLMEMDMDLNTDREYKDQKKAIAAFGAYVTMMDKVFHNQYRTCGYAEFKDQFPQEL